MSKTIVLQSHKQPYPYQWIELCTNSVSTWAKSNNYDYAFIGDELFNYVSHSILDKTKNQTVIATDLARLKLLQHYLSKSFTNVIWCDADFLIFDPENFTLPKSTYALGREVWVQADCKNKDKFVTKVKIHNAFMMFRNNNSFLDFYIDTAEKLIEINTGEIPPQFIGPKLLSALHNIAQLPVLETAGMLSPLVSKDIINEGGPALTLFKEKSQKSISAANLCSSLVEKNEISSTEIKQCINLLLKDSRSI